MNLVGANYQYIVLQLLSVGVGTLTFVSIVQRLQVLPTA